MYVLADRVQQYVHNKTLLFAHLADRGLHQGNVLSTRPLGSGVVLDLVPGSLGVDGADLGSGQLRLCLDFLILRFSRTRVALAPARAAPGTRGLNHTEYDQ